ncbi:YveK family protein [Salinicoccus roseus]|uniref:Capsule biosynthesis protein n=1 Tax=Salinicoccus roseus TaxID=45670 RepID=A0A265EBH7_9STAP|nr:Wzz/FepE/Etk N-terminal domain-containing protein [Salinicoccus roseus]OZT78628.1 capsule biosynthesis protein [Salinicoccus roseus]
MEETVNLEKVLDILKNNRTSIILWTLLGLLVALVITYYVISPRYEAQTQVLVSQPEDTMVNNENIETSLQLVQTYRDIILDRGTLVEVIDNLGLEHSVSDLADQIEVGNQDQSQVIAITVGDETVEGAESIANEVAAVFQERVMEVMNVDNVSILSPAVIEPDTDPVSPQPLINITVGLVIGLLIGMTLAFARSILDKSVRNEGDAEKYLGLPVVGSVAKFED